MKKQYIQPAMTVFTVEAQPIMADSGQLEKKIDITNEVDENQII